MIFYLNFQCKTSLFAVSYLIDNLFTCCFLSKFALENVYVCDFLSECALKNISLCSILSECALQSMYTFGSLFEFVSNLEYFEPSRLLFFCSWIYKITLSDCDDVPYGWDLLFEDKDPAETLFKKI